MMQNNKHQHRDLLVLLNNEYRSEHALQHEVEWLHTLLFHVEAIDNVCRAHELIHVNRHKIITEPHKIKREILRKSDAPFVFLNNRN
ncbi:MAG: hypothetical protein HEQ40_12445 [Lacibacter sp.]|jgi:hypothetical protein